MLSFLVSFTVTLRIQLRENPRLQEAQDDSMDHLLDLLLSDLVWAISNLISVCESATLTKTLINSHDLFDEICKLIAQSSEVQFEFIEQIIELHHEVTEVSKQDASLLCALSNFADELQSIVATLYKQIENYDREKVFKLLATWIGDLSD